MANDARPSSEGLSSASWEGATLAAVPVRPAVNLRACDEAAAQRVSALLGLAMLPTANRVAATRSGALVSWVRPDEWVVIGEVPPHEDLASALGDDGAIIDTSDARAGFTLTGPHVREVLSTCCPIDVHPDAFGRGQCAQTLIGHAGVFLAPIGADRMLVLTRPSTADYVVRWLADGIESVRLEREP